jgi:thiamine-phosphate pyrophosphorylase
MINDRVDIALAVGAEGVHVGQSDLPCRVVRKMIGPDKILGVSASNLEEAVTAQADGADYLGVGAMYATGTKTDANLTTLEQLRAIRTAVRVPIVVIGGINKKTLPNFAGIGIDGAAVVSAIVSAPDVTKAAREIRVLFENTCR